MYTLDGSGNRVYTLEVRVFIGRRITFFHDSVQKMTNEGRITKSAHPGAFAP